MIHKLRSWFTARTLIRTGSAGLGVLSLVLLARLLVARELPTLRMSAGPAGTRRHTVTTYLCEQAARNNLSINLVPSAGTEECLHLLKTGQLDVALVSSGVKVPDDDEIMVLGATQLEAVHFLVRGDMASNRPLIEVVRGKRVNIGEPGSGERLLAQEFLKFTRLKPPSADKPGDVIPTEFSKRDLIQTAQAIQRATGAEREALIAKMPEFVMVLASMPSTVVQSLVEAADYRVVSLPGTRAFLLDNLQDSHARTTVIEREFLEPTTILARSYFGRSSYPEADCETVGMRLLVVARRDVPARAVRPLMEALFEGEFARRILPRSPRELATQYAIHPAAEDYFDRDKPLAIGPVVEWASKGLSFFGAFSAGALSLYGLLRRKKIRKPSDYYAEIRQIEQIARGASVDAAVPSQPSELAIYLQDRLLGLRRDLIEDICDGHIKGDQVVANILSLINDTRRSTPMLSGQAVDLRARLLRDDGAAKHAA
jgi:TRAP-type uncharacterized transport system substrate-binding protein